MEILDNTGHFFDPSKLCPHCESTDVIRYGRRSPKGKQRWLCKTCRRRFTTKLDPDQPRLD